MAIQAISGERGRKRARKRVRKRVLRIWLKRLAVIALCLAGAVFLSMIAYRFVNPPTTAVMLIERLKGRPVQQQWVALKDVSRYLPLAVISSEDGQFCRHWGVDWGAVREAIREGGGLAGVRGASTIPMQTVKNLYLWNGRSYVRKALEAPLAYLLSFLWPKQRVMEVYLNVAQFGPGLFGAEAASRHYFGKSASKLTRREAVLLAVALPNPRHRNPARPSAWMQKIARAVDIRMPIIAKRAGCALP
jgi:monofunctional biosynthetic peptidoglycan transglycosylase